MKVCARRWKTVAAGDNPSTSVDEDVDEENFWKLPPIAYCVSRSGSVEIRHRFGEEFEPEATSGAGEPGKRDCEGSGNRDFGRSGGRNFTGTGRPGTGEIGNTGDRDAELRISTRGRRSRNARAPSDRRVVQRDRARPLHLIHGGASSASVFRQSVATSTRLAAATRRGGYISPVGSVRSSSIDSTSTEPATTSVPSRSCSAAGARRSAAGSAGFLRRCRGSSSRAPTSPAARPPRSRTRRPVRRSAK